MGEMEDAGKDFLEKAGISPEDFHIQRLADMRYSGQGHEINIEIPSGKLGPNSIPKIERAFKEEYELRYGRAIENMSLETVTWRVLVQGPNPSVKLKWERDSANDENPLKGERPVYFPDTGTTPLMSPVYDRYLLKSGDQFDGPAIIEERESTTVIGPNSRISIDHHGNIIIDLLKS